MVEECFPDTMFAVVVVAVVAVVAVVPTDTYAVLKIYLREKCGLSPIEGEEREASHGGSECILSCLLSLVSGLWSLVSCLFLDQYCWGAYRRMENRKLKHVHFSCFTFPHFFRVDTYCGTYCGCTVLSGGPLNARTILHHIDTDGDDTITWEEWLRFLGDGHQTFDQDSVINVPVDVPPSDLTKKLRDLQKIKDAEGNNTLSARFLVLSP